MPLMAGTENFLVVVVILPLIWHGATITLEALFF
jgi:hypothetical protein